jgi:hypothetical protein
VEQAIVTDPMDRPGLGTEGTNELLERRKVIHAAKRSAPERLLPLPMNPADEPCR